MVFPVGPCRNSKIDAFKPYAVFVRKVGPQAQLSRPRPYAGRLGHRLRAVRKDGGIGLFSSVSRAKHRVSQNAARAGLPRSEFRPRYTEDGRL